MPTYIGLYNLTDQGIKNIKESPGRIEEGIKGAEAMGAKIIGFYSVMGEYGMRTYDPWTVLFFAFLFAAIIWNILHPPLEALFHTYSLVQWSWILFIAVFGPVLPFGFYFEGINRIRSTHASITATLEPISAGVLAFLLLGEAMRLPQTIGGALVIAAIAVLQLQRGQDELAPEVIRERRSAGEDRRSGAGRL